MREPTPIDGFTWFRFLDPDGRVVYTRGSGPGVIVLHELPGMVPECVDLATEIARAGFTVFLPLLFGTPNVPMTGWRTLRYVAHLCISREFRLLAKDESSPITDWLRRLAREAYRRRPEHPGIGVVGMCLTGGFVLTMALDACVLAPIACQPSLPLGRTRAQKQALDIDPASLASVRDRNLPILAFRFEGDRTCPGERFERLRQELPALDARTIPGDKHSVLTIHYRDALAAGHDPRVEAIAFLNRQLRERQP
jgi:dienelactone hydrolase